MKCKVSLSRILSLSIMFFLNVSAMEIQKETEALFDITTKIYHLPSEIIVNHITPFILPLDDQTLILRFLLKDIEKGEQEDGIQSHYIKYKASIEKWLRVACERKRASIRLWKLAGNYIGEKQYSQLKKVKRGSDEWNEICVALAKEEIKNGADVNISLNIIGYEDFRTPLCCAVAGWFSESHFNKYMLELLLKNGADIELCAPLLWAIEKRNFLAVQRLINVGADINAQQWGVSALYLAVQKTERTRQPSLSNRIEKIFNLLLEKGADVNMQNEGGGSTPLFIAANIVRIDLVKVLLAHGADVAKINKLGKKAVDCVKGRDWSSCLQELVDLLEQAEHNAMEKKDEI